MKKTDSVRIVLGIMFVCITAFAAVTCSESAPADAAVWFDISGFNGEILVFGEDNDDLLFYYNDANLTVSPNDDSVASYFRVTLLPRMGTYEYILNGGKSVIFDSLTNLAGINTLIIRPVQIFTATFLLSANTQQQIAVANGGYLTAPSVAAPQGKTLTGWKLAGTEGLFDFAATPITSDFVFEPVFTDTVFEIIFIMKENIRFVCSVTMGLYSETVPEAVREGDTFAGWSEADGDLFDFGAMVIDRNYVFYPVFSGLLPGAPPSENEDPPSDGVLYTFTFVDLFGAAISAPSVIKGGTLASIPEAPAEALCVFCGWKEEGEEDFADFSTLTAQKNMRFVSVYQKVAARIVFDSDGFKQERVVPLGNLVVPPDLPPREGYNGYWQEENTEAPYDFLQAAADDLMLTAVYVPLTFAVFFDLKGGQARAGSAPIRQTVPYHGNAVPPDVTPPEGKLFAIWESGYTNITADTTVCASYSDILCHVTFEFNGAVIEIDFLYGVTFCEPAAASFEKEPPQGKFLAGWSKDGGTTLYTFGEKVTESMRLVAVFSKFACAVSFYDGSIPFTGENFPETVLYGDTLPELSAPQKPGSLFEYWSASPDLSSPYNFLDPVTGELRLYARYTPAVYRVATEVSEGISGFAVSTREASPGERITFSYCLPAGYLLAARTLVSGETETPLDSDAFYMPTADSVLRLTLSAEKYPVEVLAEGTVVSVLYGEAYAPASPACPAHTSFCGWYTDEDFVIPYRGVIEADYGETVVMYPKFEILRCDITFVYGYGNLYTQTVETAHGEMPAAPSFSDSAFVRFEGWDLPIAPAEADITYTAVYTLLFNNFYYDYDGETLLKFSRGALTLEPEGVEVPQKEDSVFQSFELRSFDPSTHTAKYRATYLALPAAPGETPDPAPDPDLPVVEEPLPTIDNPVSEPALPESSLQGYESTASTLNLLIQILFFLLCAVAPIVALLRRQNYGLRIIFDQTKTKRKNAATQP